VDGAGVDGDVAGPGAGVEAHAARPNPAAAMATKIAVARGRLRRCRVGDKPGPDLRGVPIDRGR